jgi:hypothetical protein
VAGVKARVLFVSPRGLLCYGLLTHLYVTSHDITSMHWEHGSIRISRRNGHRLVFSSMLWYANMLWEQMEHFENPNIKGKWERMHSIA